MLGYRHWLHHGRTLALITLYAIISSIMDYGVDAAGTHPNTTTILFELLHFTNSFQYVSKT